jgi:site-specific recombinase XerC
MNTELVSPPPAPGGPTRALTAAEFRGLAAVPPELEWFANLPNPRTRRAYQQDVRDFTVFVGITRPEAFRTVTRAHLIAWRKDLEARNLAPASIRRKLAALASLFDYLCERNAVPHNPADGVKRPRANYHEGLTPALGDAQARALLNAPPEDTLKGQRDRAILATLLYHGLRREELCKLRVRDLQQREGILHFRIEGKGDKIRFLPVAAKAARLIQIYLDAAGHGHDWPGPLFRPVKNNATGTLAKPLNPTSIYQDVVRRYGEQVGINTARARLLRAFAAGHRRDQRPAARRRHRQGAGMAGARQRGHHPAVRPAPPSPRRQSDLSGGVLKTYCRGYTNCWA